MSCFEGWRIGNHTPGPLKRAQRGFFWPLRGKGRKGETALFNFRGYATKNAPGETRPGAAERNFSPGGPISGTKTTEKGLLILRRGSVRPRPAARPLQMAVPSHPAPASDAEKGAGERRRRPRGPTGPHPRGAGDGGPGALGGRTTAQTRKHSGRQAARHPGRTSPRDAAPETRAPRGRDSQPTRTPTTKQGRQQRGGGTRRHWRSVRPEPLRAAACRVGGHQRQEGGEPKPPRAEEAATIEGGRRTGGQAAGAGKPAPPPQRRAGPRGRQSQRTKDKTD